MIMNTTPDIQNSERHGKISTDLIERQSTNILDNRSCCRGEEGVNALGHGIPLGAIHTDLSPLWANYTYFSIFLKYGKYATYCNFMGLSLAKVLVSDSHLHAGVMADFERSGKRHCFA